jgi:hypothetical protein
VFSVEIEGRIEEDHARATTEVGSNLIVNAMSSFEKLIRPNLLVGLALYLPFQPNHEVVYEGDQHVVLSMGITDETTVFV